MDWLAKSFIGTALAGALLLQGCAGPSGSATLYRVEQVSTTDSTQKTITENKLASIFSKPPANTSNWIKKSVPSVEMNGDDVYQIYLSDGFFKYLPDFSGVNEVVIVAEFTEVSSGTKGDTITTVLGPFSGVADRTHSPAFNKLLYGPKKLESDQISVTITVLEYDQGENQNAAAFLDFITSAGQAFSFVNPVTATERAFTKEIAKTLLTLNKDDIVLRTTFDLVGNVGTLSSRSHNGSFVPLLAGDYVLINKEGCSLGTCFGYLSKDATTYNPVAYVGDALLSIPVALRRGLTDSPDGKALSDIEAGTLRNEGQRVVHFPKSGAKESYTDKTWLTLSVVQGGDPSLWEKRKLLLNADEAVQRIVKSTGSGLQKSNDYDTALRAVEAARAQEHALQAPVKLVTGVDDKGSYSFTPGAREICLAHPDSIDSSRLQAHFYRLTANNPPQLLGDISAASGRSTPNNTCFDAKATAMTAGDYQVALFYPVNGTTQAQTLRYKVSQ
ncbi:hypothetical protein ACX3YG_09790 [Pseudomonas wadenswilerensis]